MTDKRRAKPATPSKPDDSIWKMEPIGGRLFFVPTPGPAPELFQQDGEEPLPAFDIDFPRIYPRLDLGRDLTSITAAVMMKATKAFLKEDSGQPKVPPLDLITMDYRSIRDDRIVIQELPMPSTIRSEVPAMKCVSCSDHIYQDPVQICSGPALPLCYACYNWGLDQVKAEHDEYNSALWQLQSDVQAGRPTMLAGQRYLAARDAMNDRIRAAFPAAFVKGGKLEVAASAPAAEPQGA